MYGMVKPVSPPRGWACAGRSHYHKSSLLVPRASRTPRWLGFYMSDDDDDEPVLVTVL